MPAQSKAQQKFMGMVHGLKKGEVDPSKVSGAVKKAAKSMDDKDAEDYASTKHKGLPKKINESLQIPLSSVANDLLPGNLFTVKDEKSRAELHKTLTDLKNTLNQFYKNNGINMKIR